MQLLRRLLLITVVLGLVCTSARAMTEADKFVGVWRLVSAEFRGDDGALVESLFGTEPEGMLMYDSFGNMAVQIARKNRERFASTDRLGGTPEEVSAAFSSYTAYFGRYSVDERERIVTHIVQQSLYPNQAATNLRRSYTFVDRKLILRTPPFQLRGKLVTGVLLWEKLR